MIQDIIDKVTDNFNYGIAVKDNTNGRWILNYSTLADLKIQGIASVPDALNNIEAAGYKNITVFLKRKNGTSNDYVCKNKQRVKVVLNSTQNTNMEVSENVVQAVAINSVAAPTLPQQPTTQPIMEQPLQVGLMGGLNQAQVQAFNTYSKADKYEETKESLDTALQNAKSWEEKYNILSDKFKDQNYDIRDLKREFSTLKETHEKDLEKAKKPIVSDKGVEVAERFVPMVLGLFERLAPAPVAGLAAPAEQPPKPTYSEIKTKLLDTITAVDFTEVHSQLYLNIINKTIFDTETLQQINNLLQPK